MVTTEEATYCVYPLDDLLAVLGKKWTLLIVGVLGNRSRARFNELMNALPGISPRTLSERLKDLEDLGIIERQVFAEVPLRVEYRLTRDGNRMREAMLPLLRWTANWERKPVAR